MVLPTLSPYQAYQYQSILNYDTAKILLQYLWHILGSHGLHFSAIPLTELSVHTWTAPSSLSSLSELVSVPSDSGRADPRTMITWPAAEVAQWTIHLISMMVY